MTDLLKQTKEALEAVNRIIDVLSILDFHGAEEGSVADKVKKALNDIEREEAYTKKVEKIVNHKTSCAVCGENKHCPIRNNTMGGYVCLTCVDKELEKLQSENIKIKKLAKEAIFCSESPYMVRENMEKILKIIN